MLIKNSPYKVSDIYIGANTIGWRMIREPKEKGWRMIERNDGWWIVERNVGWRMVEIPKEKF